MDWRTYNSKSQCFYPDELPTNAVAREQVLVIPGLIDGCTTSRLLIDTGACKDILFYKTFKEMGLSEEQLKRYDGRLEGFINHMVDNKGQIKLDVDIGQHPFRVVSKVTFIAIDVNSDYAAILGIPGQVALGMVASIPHQRVKFPTLAGVGCVRSTAREYLDHVLRTRKKRELEIETAEGYLKQSPQLLDYLRSPRWNSQPIAHMTRS